MNISNETCLLCGGKECGEERQIPEHPITVRCKQYENTAIIIDYSVINLGNKEEEKTEKKKRCNIISKYLLEHKVDIMKQREPKLYKFFYKDPYVIEKDDPLAIDVLELIKNGISISLSKKENI